MILDFGVTGTRRGMTTDQYNFAFNFMNSQPGSNNVGHGCCIGVDEQFATISHLVGNFKIVAYPPIVDTFFSHTAFDISHIKMARADYMERNLAIVMDSKVLLAFPEQKQEIVRSGTWSTIRMARRLKHKMIIVFPNGSISKENFDDE